MDEARREQATLAGGCFWCIEAVFEMVAGVEEVCSGYAGGDLPNPSYEQVCTGTTGHAEVVRVTFDASVIDFSELLEIFFGVHDPTTRDRQGDDVGAQYRSAVFYHSEAQRDAARAVIAALDVEGPWDDPIVTEVIEAGEFFPAEDYHAEYFARNGRQPYCRAVIAPKVAKFRERFAHRLRR
jgi:peptide-methionine (S)-S-oxide reductase